MNSEDFYITLPSNVKSYFPENTVGNYKTKLSQKLVIPYSQKWKVGLAEISYTKSYYNVTRRQTITFNEDRYFPTTQEQEASNKVPKVDLSDGHHQSKQRKDTQIKPITTTTSTATTSIAATTIQPKTTIIQSQPITTTITTATHSKSISTTAQVNPNTLEIKQPDVQIQDKKSTIVNPEPVTTITSTTKIANQSGFSDSESRRKKYNEIREFLRDAEDFKDEWDDKLEIDILFALHSLEQFRRGDEITDTEMDNNKVVINKEWSDLPPRLSKRLSLITEGIEQKKEDSDIFTHEIGVSSKPNVQSDEPVKKNGQYINTQQGVIKPGFYDDVENFVKHLNEQMQVHKWVSFCFIKYDKHSHRVTVKPGIDIEGNLYYPNFGSEVEQILGLVDYNDKTLFDYLNSANLSKELTNMVYSLLNGEKWKSFRPVELHASFHTLYLYTNIVQHSFVGDSFSQLLRQIEIPQNSRWGEQIVLKYDEPHYIPLCTNIIEIIEIDFKNELGHTLPFEFGRTIVKLHLVRYE